MTSRVFTISIVAAVFALVSACTSISLVEPEKRVEIGNAFSVASPITWNKFSDFDLEYWTVDAPSLQHIVYVKGVKPGDAVFPVRPTRDNPVDTGKLPKFRKDMTAIEVVEAFETCMIRDGAEKMEISEIRPEKVGLQDGFRFEFTYETKNGLEMQGFGLGVIRNEELYLALYRGTRMYFFSKHREDAEAVFRSIEFPPEQKGFSLGLF